MERKIRQGWPRVLLSLKSLLETGRPLQTWVERYSSFRFGVASAWPREPRRHSVALG